MEVKEILCMKQAEGKNSYANSAALVLAKVGAKTRHIVKKAAGCLVTEHVSSSMCLNIADLGCGFGLNPLDFISTVIESVEQKCKELKQGRVPEIQFFLNDLPGNDFNTLFKEISVFRETQGGSWFPRGVPGSFHCQLFPQNSLHLVYSCYSVHWLSKAPEIMDEEGLPLNKGKIYISKSSPLEVTKAYLTQFQQDMSSMLKFRSQEIVPKRCMVLIFNGRKSGDIVNSDSYYFWETIAQAASYLVSQGVIAEEKLDYLNIPFYNPTQEEVEEVLDKENSLITEFIDTIELDLGGQSMWSSPEERIRCYRSISEAIMSKQFGKHVMDELYDKATQILIEDLKQGKEATKNFSIVVLLKKREI